MCAVKAAETPGHVGITDCNNQPHPVGQRPVLTRQRPRSETAVGDGGTKLKFRDDHRTILPTQDTRHPCVQVRTKADFPFGVWDAFFWQEQKKAPQEGRNPRGLHHLSPGGERDVEDAVPYGVLVCEPPRIAALPNATAHVRRRGTHPSLTMLPRISSCACAARGPW